MPITIPLNDRLYAKEAVDKVWAILAEEFVNFEQEQALASSSSSRGCQCSRQQTESRGCSKGHSKKKVTDLDVYLVNFRGTNQPLNYFFLHFFF
jgi:hypothetical protein